jgi:hypothetical protein
MARKEPLAKIAKTLKRTAGATRQKATNIGVSQNCAQEASASKEGLIQLANKYFARQCQSAGVRIDPPLPRRRMLRCSAP